MGNNHPNSRWLSSALAALFGILIPPAATFGWWQWNTHTDWDGGAVPITLGIVVVVYLVNFVWIRLTQATWVLLAACGTALVSIVLGSIGFLKAKVIDVGSGRIDIGSASLPTNVAIAVAAGLMLGLLFLLTRVKRARHRRRQGKK